MFDVIIWSIRVQSIENCHRFVKSCKIKFNSELEEILFFFDHFYQDMLISVLVISSRNSTMLKGGPELVGVTADEISQLILITSRGRSPVV